MEAGALVIQQRMQSFGAAETELEWNGPEVAEHQTRGAVNPFNPVGELTGIGNGGGKGHQLHRQWAVNDRLLPNRAALRVVHVVAFIEHHRLHIRQRVIGLVSFRVQHVAEDLRGHHHD